jgi:hypothetical protein
MTHKPQRPAEKAGRGLAPRRQSNTGAINKTIEPVTTGASFVLPIDDRYRLAADEYAWRIERRKGKSWRAIEWHSSIESAINSLGRWLVRTSQVASLPEALAAIDRVVCPLRDALESHFHVARRPGSTNISGKGMRDALSGQPHKTHPRTQSRA